MINRSLNVLISDDDVDILKSLSNTLQKIAKKTGHILTISHASSISETLKISNSIHFDIIILDYHFEAGLSGAEFFKYYNDTFSDTFFIMISGRDENEITKSVDFNKLEIPHGRFNFIRKPVENLQLTICFQSALKFLYSEPLPHLVDYPKYCLETIDSDSYFIQISLLRDIIESSLRFFVTILFADCLKRNTLYSMHKNLNFNENMGLGGFLYILKQSIDKLSSMNTNFWLQNIFLILDKKTIKFLEKFTQKVRNDNIGHHGLTQDDYYYKELYYEFLPKVLKFYRNLSFLRNYKLVVPETVNFLPDNVSNEYNLRLLMGYSQKFTKTLVVTPNRLIKSRVYLMDSTCRTLEVHPFIRHEICPKCKQKNVFFIDSIVSEKFIYKSFCNHIITKANPLVTTIEGSKKDVL